MQAEHDRVAVADGAVEPLDDVAVDVRRVHLDGTGRLRISLSSTVGLRTSITASQISRAKSGSVPVKLSGVYS